MNGENYIVKSNKLVEAKGKMTTLEQKLFSTLVSEITPDDKDFKEYVFSIKNFIRLTGTNENKIYIDIHKSAKNLMNKIITIETDKTIMTTALLSSVETPKGEGIIKITFHPFLKPYLLDLKQRFTKYQLKNILTLKGSHSIRIYELLKQYERIGKREFKLNALKKILGLENEYDRIYDFEKYVLKTANIEINRETDLSITYEKIKIGRKIDSILFYIEPKQVDFEEETLKKFKENKVFDFEKVRKKANLTESKLNDKQILELYEIACEITDRLSQINYNVDVYKYMDFNYKYSKLNAKKSIFSFYKKALKEDFANAKIAMMK